MKKRKMGRVLLSLIVGYVVGLMIIRFPQSYIVRTIAEGRKMEYCCVAAGSVLFAVLLHTIIHEAGHLVFGLLTGYRFNSFRVGSLMLLNERGKLVLRRHSLPGTAGQCLMAPPPLIDGKIPVVLYNMGGCIMNLISSAFFLFAMIAAPYGSVMEFVWAVLMGIGVLLALINGIPGGEDLPNDGRNMISLLRDEAAIRAVWIQMEVNYRFAQGEKVAQMPEAWFDMPTTEQMKNHAIAYLAVLRTDRLLAEGKTQAADSLMEALISGEFAIMPLHRSLLRMQRIWLELMGENRPEVIKELLTGDVKRFMKAMRKNPAVIRTEYALAHLYHRDEKNAQACLKRFDKAVKWYAYRLQLDEEQRLLEEARQKTIKT